ncbi:DUF6701 domain-containing protein [Denitratisoma sp. agr-D3]
MNTGIRRLLQLCLCWLLTAFAPLYAATYTFSGGSFPTCSSGWSSSGSTWTCTSSINLANGDKILPASAITVVARAGITLSGNNTVGSSSVTVNLTTTYGDFTSSATSTIYGSVTTDSGDASLTGTTVNGNIVTGSGAITLNTVTVTGSLTADSGNITLTGSSVSGGITTNGWLSISGGSVGGNVSAKNGVTSSSGTTFAGNVAASNGAVSLSGGSVTGSVSSVCCAVTTSNTNVGNGISSTNNTVTITGGTVSGNIYSAGGSGIIITNATILSATISDGDITATNVRITITNSTIGTPSTPVNVTSNNNVTISGSTIYGDVTAGNWSTALSIDSSSTIYGTCTSNSNSNVSPPDYPRCTTASGVNTARFNACHNYASGSCSVAAGRLYTRLAGTAFSTDLVALKADGTVDSSFTGKVTVSLIARATSGGALDGNNCFTPDATQAVDNAVTSFAAGRLTVSATLSTAYQDVRFKFVCNATNCAPSGLTSCSANNFAVRPSGFTAISASANADASGSSTTATPTVAAGGAFTLSATAQAGYNGTPKINTAQAVAHGGAVATGVLAGSFNAGNVATGVASGNSFTYTEAGYFRLGINGIYDDSFTFVDQAVGDCTSDYSNTLVGGKYGCYFGNTAATSYFGRFIPHHFATAVAQHGCPSGSFTYSGQPLTLTVTALNSGGDTTRNYHGSAPVFAKATTLSAWASDGTTANPGSGTLSPTSLAVTAFSSGVANATPSYSYAAKLTAANTLRLRAVDSEGVSSASGSEGTSPIRSGQLRLYNAFGSENATLSLPVQAQYWSGSSWVLNSDDNCTTVPVSGFFLSGALAAKTSVNTALVLSGGKGNVVLKSPAPTTGSVDVAADLGSSGSDVSCLSSHGGTAANLPWLRSRNGNCAATYDRDPSARATFGVYAPETKRTVHIRELY